jgi:hypothetical protein
MEFWHGLNGTSPESKNPPPPPSKKKITWGMAYGGGVYDYLEVDSTTFPLYEQNPITIQEPDYYSRTRLLYKNPITIQEPDYYTRTRLLYKNPITIQE